MWEAENGHTKMLTCESPEPINITLHGKKDLADVIKLRILTWGD